MSQPDPAEPYKPVPQRNSPLDHNSVLARAALSAPEAREGLSLLSRVAPRPRDGFGAGYACSGASKAVAAALDFLGEPVDSVKLLGQQLAALNAGVALEIETSGTGEVVAPRERRLANHPGWGMCIALGASGAHSAGLIVGGLLIFWADHKGRAVPTAQAKAVIRHGVPCELTPGDLHALLDSDQDAADTSWPWLAWLQRHWAAMRNAFGVGGGPPPSAPTFERRARWQLFARAHYASPARRAGVPTHRDLSRDQYAQACTQVALWLEEDDWRGAYAFMVATTSFSIDLMPSMPLADAAPDAWVAKLDIDRGTQSLDLSHLAEEAASTPQGGNFVPADLILERPLPKALARHLRFRCMRYPEARTLSDLYPEAPNNLFGHMAMIPSTNAIGASWARWTNSAGVYLRQAGMDNFLAGIQSGDLGHAPRSKLYYAVITRSEIWAGAATFFEQSGFGAPVPDPGGGVAFGSRVVSTVDGLRRAAAWLRTEAGVMRPARRDRDLAKLLEYHNRFTRWVAFELALLLALRETKEYELWADIDETVDLWVAVVDKSVPGPKGASPVPLSERVKAAISAYRIHCRAVADRLVAVGYVGSSLHRRLCAIQLRDRVPLLCMASGLETIRRPGTADTFGSLPTPLIVAVDAGRKWAENALRHAALRTGDIDGVLRHEVVGQSRTSSTSDFVVLEWAARVAAAIDVAAAEILGSAVTGLARR